jgi:hypothetical protein
LKTPLLESARFIEKEKIMISLKSVPQSYPPAKVLKFNPRKTTPITPTWPEDVKISSCHFFCVVCQQKIYRRFDNDFDCQRCKRERIEKRQFQQNAEKSRKWDEYRLANGDKCYFCKSQLPEFSYFMVLCEACKAEPRDDDGFYAEKERDYNHGWNPFPAWNPY